MSMLRVWGGKLFSLAGRITLVKSVLLTYPTFHSANSMVPKKVLYEIDKICKEFIWRKRDGNAGLHYVSWNLMCRPRDCGGLGINSCYKHAGTLRAKLAWRYIQNE
ncbi:Putative ribonuclease H protein [Dendrobium catenatum]|uniref:Ribonuclease H protein n=1 Tax=Dendrobium catenatum TaxID=906689 RepID=A0A2I0WSN1_9ASPA|nr:Putative ribonuclease H protein [Dendrobium catenatum]